MIMLNVLDDPNEVERLHSTPVQVRKVLMMMIMAGSRKYKSTRGGQEPKLSFLWVLYWCDFFISESDQVLSIFGNYLPNKKAHYNGWCKRRGVRFVFVLWLLVPVLLIATLGRRFCMEWWGWWTKIMHFISCITKTPSTMFQAMFIIYFSKTQTWNLHITFLIFIFFHLYISCITFTHIIL